MASTRCLGTMPARPGATAAPAGHAAVRSVDRRRDAVGDRLLERGDAGSPASGASGCTPRARGRNLARAFLIGQAAPSARPQIVVPGMMPMLLASLEHDVEVFDPAAARP